MGGRSSLALGIACAALIVAVAGVVLGLNDDTTASADLNEGTTASADIADGSVELKDLAPDAKKLLLQFRGPPGPRGPRGPQGEANEELEENLGKVWETALYVCGSLSDGARARAE